MDKTSTTEKKIIEAAMNVFLEKGRHGARMQQIADTAGINKSLLHYYFRSKENLYATIFERVFLIFFSRIKRAVDPTLPFNEQLKTFINTYFDILNRNRHIPLFLAREMSEGGAVVQDFMRRYRAENPEAYPTLFITAIEQAAARCEIRQVDPQQFIMSLIGACIFFFVAQPVITALFTDAVAQDTETFIQARKEAVFDLFYNGLKPRGEDV